MLLICPELSLGVSGQARDSSSKTSGRTVRNTLAPVTGLPSCLLALAGRILLPALVLQSLGTDKATDSLLGRPDGLVPAAFLTLGVVCRYTGAGDGHAAN